MVLSTPKQIIQFTYISLANLVESGVFEFYG